MIYRFLAGILLFFLIFGLACNAPKISAKQYHTQLKTSVDTIIPYFIKLDYDIALDSTNKISNHHKRLKEVIEISYEFMEQKAPYSNETALYNSYKNLIQFYKDYVSNEINQVIAALEENPDDVNLKEKARIVFVQFYEKEQVFLNAFNQASIDFTYKYKIYKIKSSD